MVSSGIGVSRSRGWRSREMPGSFRQSDRSAASRACQLFDRVCLVVRCCRSCLWAENNGIFEEASGCYRAPRPTDRPDRVRNFGRRDGGRCPPGVNIRRCHSQCCSSANWPTRRSIGRRLCTGRLARARKGRTTRCSRPTAKELLEMGSLPILFSAYVFLHHPRAFATIHYSDACVCIFGSFI